MTSPMIISRLNIYCLLCSCVAAGNTIICQLFAHVVAHHCFGQPIGRRLVALECKTMQCPINQALQIYILMPDMEWPLLCSAIHPWCDNLFLVGKCPLKQVCACVVYWDAFVRFWRRQLFWQPVRYLSFYSIAERYLVYNWNR